MSKKIGLIRVLTDGLGLGRSHGWTETGIRMRLMRGTDSELAQELASFPGSLPLKVESSQLSEISFTC